VPGRALTPKKDGDPLHTCGSPPRLGYSVKEFCAAVGISISYYYELKRAGLAPRTMQDLGSRQIISVDEARRWCAERTEAHATGQRTGAGERN
jgi:hypothetical protein